MLNRIREPFVKVEYTTAFIKESINTVRKTLIKNCDNNEQAKMELVLRAINGDLDLTDEASVICNQILSIYPKHNFFNLARAILGLEKEYEYFFLIAIHSTKPCGDSISAQAAYQLARYYFMKQQYLISQAWLSKSVMLEYKKAEIDLCSRGCARDKITSIAESHLFKLANPSANPKKYSYWDSDPADFPYNTAVRLAMLTAIILSGKTIPDLNNVFLGSKNDDCCYLRSGSDWGQHLALSWIPPQYLYIIQLANQTVSPFIALHNPDTMLYRLARYSLDTSPVLFFELMTYCTKNMILSCEAYKNILVFLKTYLPTKNKNLLMDGWKTLTELETQYIATTSKEITDDTLTQYASTTNQQVLSHSTTNIMQALQTHSLLTTTENPPPLTISNALAQQPLMPSFNFEQQFPLAPSHLPAHLFPSIPTSTLSPIYLTHEQNTSINSKLKA